MGTRKTTRFANAKQAAPVAQLGRESRLNPDHFQTPAFSFVLDEALKLRVAPIAYPIVHSLSKSSSANSFEVFQHYLSTVKSGNDALADVVVNPSHKPLLPSTQLPKKPLGRASAFSLKNRTQILKLPLNLLDLSRVKEPAFARDSEVVNSEVNSKNTFYEQTYIPENGNETCYTDETKWNEFVAALKKKYAEHPENYKEFEKSFMKAGNEYMETSRAISKIDLKKSYNGELRRLYTDYLNKNLIYGPYIWMQFIINNFFSEMAKEIITTKLGKDNKALYEYIETALKPSQKAASIQLNEIAAQWEKLSEVEKTKTYENFKWVPCLDVHNLPWTKEEFYSHVSEFRKTEKATSITYEKMLEDVKPSEKEKQTVEIARSLSYLKDLKDDFRRQGIFYAQSLFREIASRAGLNLSQISYATEEEIANFLNGSKEIPKDKTEERKKGFAIYFDKENNIQCKSGKDVEAALNELGLVISEEFSEEIKGSPASPGRAKGTATIVRGVSDLNKVKKGDILVAVTTHPDYVPAMQKAAAIVTDEGGITSHAAIVARELGIPCVVGAKNSTKALKDSDMIEVDANTGTVRKIKK